MLVESGVELIITLLMKGVRALISRSEMKTCFSFLAKVNSRVESYCLAGREDALQAGSQWMHHLTISPSHAMNIK